MSVTEEVIEEDDQIYISGTVWDFCARNYNLLDYFDDSVGLYFNEVLSNIEEDNTQGEELDKDAVISDLKCLAEMLNKQRLLFAAVITSITMSYQKQQEQLKTVGVDLSYLHVKDLIASLIFSREMRPSNGPFHSLDIWTKIIAAIDYIPIEFKEHTAEWVELLAQRGFGNEPEV